MRHRNGPEISSIPELAAVFAELRTEKVPNPPRGYATVERILLPDGSCIHESSQYGFAEVVARWLWSNGYRARQGTVAAYEANERYLAGECGMGDGWVHCNRRRSIAQSLAATQVRGAMWIAGLPSIADRVAVGDTEINALARAVERLMRAGHRVSMSPATTQHLLAGYTSQDLGYEPTQEDMPWIADLQARRRLSV